MEEEMKLLPISQFYDRTDEGVIAKCQRGFLLAIVIPFYEVLGKFMPEFEESCCKNLQIGLQNFENQIGQEEIKAPSKQAPRKSVMPTGLFGHFGRKSKTPKHDKKSSADDASVSVRSASPSPSFVESTAKKDATA